MYNPSAVGKKGSLFGLPYSVDESDLVILPVNLDVTTSYGEGTSKAPARVLEESTQLDLSLPGIIRPWELKQAIQHGPVAISDNEKYRMIAKSIITDLENGKTPSSEDLDIVNNFCHDVHSDIKKECEKYLENGKWVGILGGDHSSPLGLIQALAKRESFGILQIDAHMDLREAYEGFTYSHASIMFNALREKGVKSLTQVGIRDYCEEETNFINASEKRIHTFYDEQIYQDSLHGRNWDHQTAEIIDSLPENVYLSFDIDGLEPSLCPNTGTPVPGGLSFNQIVYLLNQLVGSGRKIIGFDLCEVGDAKWDANVCARILYRLGVCLGLSNGLLSAEFGQ